MSVLLVSLAGSLPALALDPSREVVGLVILLIVWVLYRLHVRHLVRRSEVLEAEVAEQSAELAEQEKELAQVNEELRQLVEALRDKTDQLEDARVTAERASRAKSDFLARMSHELRTPLTSVIGFTNLLLKNKRSNLQDADTEYLRRILANGKHLLKLINGILDPSKIEAGKVDLELGLVAVDRLVGEMIAQMEGRLVGRDVALVAEVPSQLEPLYSDEGKLRQVLFNLVGNAIKFTEHGWVKVEVAVDPLSRRPVRIDVRDTGIGIPPDRQPVIFEPFVQGERRSGQENGGTGLGLAISSSLCQLMGFRLVVDSRPGEGSVFSILLSSTGEGFGSAPELARPPARETAGISGAA